ncbi:flagellar motor switch protein FliN [Asaia siamensis]|uniref:Flagellar motor switch protein FliN n=1 Tax=Asaia siamensis TaxID=110479 RepID=A0ABQ1L8E3_9PROT|nr:flagellar motor switch protein FliN [Asaia siamensis]GBR09829.1 flagellar motor switch protein [Asaia siamensis NRIC 0323]GGC18899.1 flagellar motor switch protein FliN [Asaia siamensis]
MDDKNEMVSLEDFTSEPFAPQDASSEAAASQEASTGRSDAVYDIPVKITAVIGTATMPVSQLLRLGRGAVVELNKKLGEAVDIYANNRLIARGELVVVDDNNIGVTMTEILSSSSGAASK